MQSDGCDAKLIMNIPLVPPENIPQNAIFRTERFRLSSAGARAAPTLQELPPEKGAILELHSINDDYNGMLVEFYNIDKATGKYSVISYDDKHQAMKVKLRCLKRPDIKSLDLRKTLKNFAARLASNVVDTRNVTESTSYDHEESQILKILQVDPCNTLAHYCLAQIVERKVDAQTCDPKDKNYKGMVKHVRRAISNFYAYDGIVDPELLVLLKAKLIGLLESTGKTKAARRLQEKIGAEHNLRTPVQEVMEQFMVARGLLITVRNGWNPSDMNLRFQEGVTEGLKALRMIHALVEDLDENEAAQLRGTTNDLVLAHIQVITWYTQQVKAMHDVEILKPENLDSDGNLVRGPQDMTTCLGVMLLMAADTLEECTLEDGSVPFLKDDYAKILEDGQFAAASALEVFDPTEG